MHVRKGERQRAKFCYFSIGLGLFHAHTFTDTLIEMSDEGMIRPVSLLTLVCIL